MKKALVIGSAECLFEDVRKAREIGAYDALFVVKMTGCIWPEPFDFWPSLHPEYFPGYEAERKKRGLPGGYQTVAPPEKELNSIARGFPVNVRNTYLFPGLNASGGSGLYAAKCAIDFGFQRVVLAGVPMTTEKHFARGKNWTQRDSFVKGWREALPLIKATVRSMSGWSRQLLGAPTPEWLHGE